MDPIAQVLAQQSSGSAEGQGFGADFARGQEFNLRNRYLALQQHVEQRATEEQKVLLPLKADMLRIQNQSLGAEAVAKVEKAKIINDSNMELPQIYQFQQLMMESPEGANDPELRAQIFKRAAQNQRAYAPGTPGWDLIQQTRGGIMFKTMLKQLEDADAALSTRDLAVRSIDPVTGKIDVMKSPNVELEKELFKAELRGMFGANYAPGPMAKDFDTIDKQDWSPEKKARAKEVRAALEPKQATRKAAPTESEYVDKHIDHFVTENPGVKRPQAVQALRDEWKATYGKQAPVNAQVRRYNPATGKLE